MGESQRRGDVRKCPVCGAQVDPDAYYCATCHNYYCFHCRARLLPGESQLHCVDQACEYYGKLVCDVCDLSKEREEPGVEYLEPQDGYWPLWLVLSALFGGLLWYQTSLRVLPVLLISAGVFFLGGLALHFMGMNIFGREKRVPQPRMSTYRACVRCSKPVKEVGGSA